MLSGLTMFSCYLAKTWPASLDVSKEASGVWGHARKISHKSRGRCRVPEHVHVDVDVDVDSS